MIGTSDRVKFLKNHHLFHGLSDIELTQIAESLEEKTYSQDMLIIKQNSQNSGFFLIIQGKIRIYKIINTHVQQLAELVAKDYFGEIPLNTPRIHTTNAESIGDSLLFWFPPQIFNRLIANIPKFKSNLKVLIDSRKLARRLHIQWLEPNETIYFVTHKHPIFLLRSLLAPVVLFVIFLFLAILASLQEIAQLLISLLAGIVLLIDFLWGIWLYIDWLNDYYVITNQRFIWLEKILLVRESRQESPISAILSVDVTVDLIGRELDYGDVLIRTFVGQIPMLQVSHPYQAGQILDELLSRYKEIAERTEIETTKQLLRDRLGLPSPSRPEIPISLSAITPKDNKRPNTWSILFGKIEWFRMRIEKQGTITYRKHWIVLLRQTWKPGLFLFIGMSFFIYRVMNFPLQPPDEINNYLFVTLLTVLFLVPIFLWWLYEYIDWGNDLFRITPSQVIDIDRTVWGSEQRRSAPLGSIQSTESRRIGLFGQIFNYGTVYISVGNMLLTFDEVHDPVNVQREIDRHRLARINDENKEKADAERERIVDWLVTYHHNAEEFRQQEQENNKSKPE